MKALILTVFTLVAIPLLAGVTLARAQEAGPVVTASPAKPPVILPTLGTSPGDSAPLRQTVNNRMINTIDGTTLHLQSGETVELSAIWIPQGAGYQPSDELVRAKQFLDSILMDNDGDRNVTLYQTNLSGQGRINRLGHEMAHVVRKNGNVWLQGALIANGLAQAWPTPVNPELAGRLYVLEDNARRAGLGMWAADSQYRMLNALDDMPNLDRFAVIEGMVKSISMVSNVTYLNFGDDWKTDFTIGVSSPIRQVLLRNNVDLQKLQGQNVRVRGWLRSYNGPYIELEDSIALETLDIAKSDNIVSGAPQLSVRKRAAPQPSVTINNMKAMGQWKAPTQDNPGEEQKQNAP
ncbi:MAG: nuclease family protein [Micavibrio sp.]|nr:nuclease family protein [Micavibrio sp.]